MYDWITLFVSCIFIIKWNIIGINFYKYCSTLTVSEKNVNLKIKWKRRIPFILSIFCIPFFGFLKSKFYTAQEEILACVLSLFQQQKEYGVYLVPFVVCIPSSNEESKQDINTILCIPFFDEFFSYPFCYWKKASLSVSLLLFTESKLVRTPFAVYRKQASIPSCFVTTKEGRPIPFVQGKGHYLVKATPLFCEGIKVYAQEKIPANGYVSYPFFRDRSFFPFFGIRIFYLLQQKKGYISISCNWSDS